MTKVFISHSSRDRDIVERDIIALLNSNGIETWYSGDDIPTGAAWEREIERALSGSDWFLIVLSRNSAQSEYVKDELNLAIRTAPDRVVPVMIEPCDPADFHIRLPRIHYVDFRHDPKAKARLLMRFGVNVADDADADTSGPPAAAAAGAESHDAPDGVHRQRASLIVPPFHFGGVVPPKYFTDREQELAEAKRIIRGQQSLLLVGEHRAGKTSFCKMLIHRMMGQPRNDVLVTYINVQQWPAVTIETFLEHTILSMIGEVARQVFGCKYMALASPDPARDYPALQRDDSFRAFVELYRLIRRRTYSQDAAAPAPFQAHEFVQFHEELLQIIQDKGWRSCVVFYDEANRLPVNVSVDLLVSHEEALSMAGITSVFAASPAMMESFKPLQESFGHQVHLGPFPDPSDMLRLLASYCLGDAGRIHDVPASRAAMNLLWRRSGGKPYTIQLIAGWSFRLAAKNGDRRVEEQHVDEAFRRLKEANPRTFAGIED